MNLEVHDLQSSQELEQVKKTFLPEFSFLKNDVEKSKRKEQGIIDKYQDITKNEINKESIKTALSALNTAQTRLLKNTKFSEMYNKDDISIDKYFPLILKESNLDPKKKSNSGAIGYFQLKEDAITDAKDFLKGLSITKKYNVKNPIDNCILGMVYHLTTVERNIQKITKVDADNFSLASYNMGLTRFKNIYNIIKKDLNKEPTREEFANYLVEKCGITPEQKRVEDETYWTYYIDRFNGEIINKDHDDYEDEILGGNITKGKAYESIRYVELINGLKNREKRVIKEGEIIAKKGEGARGLLRRGGITPNANTVEEFKKVNSIENDSLQEGKIYRFSGIQEKIKPEEKEEIETTEEHQKIIEMLLQQTKNGEISIEDTHKREPFYVEDKQLYIHENRSIDEPIAESTNRSKKDVNTLNKLYFERIKIITVDILVNAIEKGDLTLEDEHQTDPFKLDGERIEVHSSASFMKWEDYDYLSSDYKCTKEDEESLNKMFFDRNYKMVKGNSIWSMLNDQEGINPNDERNVRRFQKLNKMGDSIIIYAKKEYIVWKLNGDQKEEKEEGEKTPEKQSSYKEIKERFAAGNKYYLEKYEALGKQKLIDMYADIEPPTIITVDNRKTGPKPLYKKDIKKVILHSTGYTYSDDKARASQPTTGSGAGIYAHMFIGQDGKIYKVERNKKRRKITHAGFPIKPIRNGKNINNCSVGIEVEAANPGEWTEEQYESVKKVLKWIATDYNPELKASDVLTHSQVAGTKYRGIKPDPYYVNRPKLGLPNNYTLFDPDVASGKMGSNLGAIKIDWGGEDIGLSNTQIRDMTSGLRVSDQISK